jgi:hypothetical protein
MGNPYVYYYPERDAGIETIDLGRPLTSLPDTNEPVGGSLRGMGGQVFPSSLGRFDRVRATLDGITSEDTEAALRTFEAYAETFRPFGFSADHAKSWAGYCDRLLVRGTTTIPTGGNAFAAMSASGAVTTGDYVVIETGYPEWKWEKAKVASVSGSTITLSAGLKRTYRETPILIRWYRFWPALVVNPAPMLVDVKPGRIWRFGLDAYTVALANPRARLLALTLESGTGGSKSGGKATLGDLISRQARDDGLGSWGAGRPRGGGGK